jgi:hypothetical protein
MMEVTLTCDECKSAVSVYPDQQASIAKCTICQHEHNVTFTKNVLSDELDCCPKCERKDFYKQKDFNRKIGVTLFVIAAIASIWTYGVSLIFLWLVDLFLFSKIPDVVSCYKCETLFRKVKNLHNIEVFNHEMNDRIIYSDHNFEGKSLSH